MNDEQFDRAESFWIRKDAVERQMEPAAVWDAIDGFLSQRKICALATGGNGFVRCTPLEYGWHDGALWIFTEGGLKFKALRASRVVSVAVFDADGSFGGLKSVQMQGTAELVEPFSDEYRQAAQQRGVTLETLQRLPEPLWLLKIVPDEVTILDSAFKKEGFGNRQTWKR